MAKRITIMIDDDIDKKVRIMQAKIIREQNKTMSFSRTLNELLAKELK